MNSSSKKRLVRGAGVAVLVLALVFLWRPLVAWFTGGEVGSGSEGATVAADAGELKLDLALNPDPPRQQDNALIVKVVDAAGKPVKDAEVAVTYSMPAMGAMPEMKGEADVEHDKNGRYVAKFDLPMGGTWTLETRVKKGESTGISRHTMTVGSEGLTPVATAGPSAKASEPASGTGGSGTEVAPVKLTPDAFQYVKAAFAAYESVRESLAGDDLLPVPARANELAKALREAARAAGREPADLAACLSTGANTAEQLAQASSLERARSLFSEMSQYLVALGAADARLQEGWYVFECPMVKDGFNKWVQQTPTLENPYMGKRMLSCGSPSKWEVAVPPAKGHESAEAHEGHDEVSHYTCSMHPSVKQEGPGACPICGMDLSPVTKGEAETGVILVDEGRRQRIGVKTTRVTLGEMDAQLRALGRIAVNEGALQDVTLKLDGYIEELKVDTTGEPVKKGDVLFTLYSPELYAAQQEYILARNSQSSANASLARAARKRLELLGLTNAQIERIAARGEPIQNMPFLAPATGYVLEKNVVQGASVKAGETLFRIVPLERVWVEADVYEQDMQRVKVGQPVKVTLQNQGNRTYEGKVDFVYPTVDPQTRTGRVRIELPNPDLTLKPDMYANVTFDLPQTEERLRIPKEAVIYTGPRTLVFLDLGEGRLKPQEVKLGLEGEEMVEVVEGLSPGDEVVTSGNFLIAAESRIRSAGDYWGGGEE